MQKNSDSIKIPVVPAACSTQGGAKELPAQYLKREPSIFCICRSISGGTSPDPLPRCIVAPTTVTCTRKRSTGATRTSFLGELRAPSGHHESQPSCWTTAVKQTSKTQTPSWAPRNTRIVSCIYDCARSTPRRRQSKRRWRRMVRIYDQRQFCTCLALPGRALDSGDCGALHDHVLVLDGVFGLVFRENSGPTRLVVHIKLLVPGSNANIHIQFHLLIEMVSHEAVIKVSFEA